MQIVTLLGKNIIKERLTAFAKCHLPEDTKKEPQGGSQKFNREASNRMTTCHSVRNPEALDTASKHL